MIVRTLLRAKEAGCFDRVICATDSQQIASVVERAGFDAVITGSHPTGSDRVAEVSALLNLDLVVNLQGDEPVASLELLRQVAKSISRDASSWVTAMSPLAPSEFSNLNVVKVHIVDGIATDFLRTNPQGEGWHSHRGIYAYSAESLEEFAALPQSVLERERSIEPLRILGRRPIRVITSLDSSISVDVPADIERVTAFLLRSHP